MKKIILLLLLDFFLSLIYFFNTDINPFVISQNHPSKTVKVENFSIHGIITSKYDYFGIILLRFNQQNILTGDSEFKIKPLTSLNWYQIATIEAAQYSTDQYPFGFPAISNSKGRKYQFEIDLLDKTNGQKFELSKSEPVIVSQYLYPKELLFTDGNLLLQFMYHKITYYISGNDAWKTFIVYSIPALLYLLYICVLAKFLDKKYLNNVKICLNFLEKPICKIAIILILSDIFLVRLDSEIVTFCLTFIWILAIITYSLENQKSFILSLIFLSFCPFLMSVSMNWVAEKCAVWAYIFLVVGTIHTVFIMNGWSESLANFVPIRILIGLIRLSCNTVGKVIRVGVNMYSFIGNKIKYKTYMILSSAIKRGIKGWIILGLQTFVILVVLTAVFRIGFTIALSNYRRIQAENHQKLRLSLNPHISAIEPTLVYKSIKVNIYGKNFGWNKDSLLRMAEDEETVSTDLWTDSKIIFTIPLHWRVGLHHIWIEKPLFWDGQEIIAKSQVIPIQLIPVTGSFTATDDAFFNQLKHLRKETLEINGY